MTIDQLTLFLKQNIRQVKNEILSELGPDFTTLDFVRKFAKKFEGEYIKYLYYNKGKGSGAFNSVHNQIARFLSDNGPILNIHKSRKAECEDELGEIGEIQVWEKKKNVYQESYY